MFKQLQKYSNKATIKRSSSPKILPLAPALYSIDKDAEIYQEELGRAFEIAVGSELVRLPGELYYWRKGKFEVDYVYPFGKTVTAIEVKFGKGRSSKGLQKFQLEFPHAELKICTPENYQKIINDLQTNA